MEAEKAAAAERSVFDGLQVEEERGTGECCVVCLYLYVFVVIVDIVIFCWVMYCHAYLPCKSRRYMYQYHPKHYIIHPTLHIPHYSTQVTAVCGWTSTRPTASPSC